MPTKKRERTGKERLDFGACNCVAATWNIMMSSAYSCCAGGCHRPQNQLWRCCPLDRQYRVCLALIRTTCSTHFHVYLCVPPSPSTFSSPGSASTYLPALLLMAVVVEQFTSREFPVSNIVSQRGPPRANEASSTELSDDRV